MMQTCWSWMKCVNNSSEYTACAGRLKSSLKPPKAFWNWVPNIRHAHSPYNDSSNQIHSFGMGTSSQLKFTQFWKSIFFLLCEDIQDLDYETALRQLIYYCMMLIDYVPKELAKIISCQVRFWIAAQPLYIQRLFSNLCYESWVYNKNLGFILLYLINNVF